MPTCPRGHASAADDYCDECGRAMPRPVPPDPGTVPSGPEVTPPGPGTVPAPGAAEFAGIPRCPVPGCHTPRLGRYCEACGYDFEAAGPAGSDPPATGWTAVVFADRHHYERTSGQGVAGSRAVRFPAHCPERRYPLSGRRVLVGRRSRARGAAPDIDLAGPGEDPGVSHEQALLLAQPDGTWAVEDPGSTNGVAINDDPGRIPAHVEVSLRDGDRIYVGAWTCILLRRGG